MFLADAQKLTTQLKKLVLSLTIWNQMKIFAERGHLKTVTVKTAVVSVTQKF